MNVKVWKEEVVIPTYEIEPTVWCSEVERISRTKGMTGFTLYPDKAYLEIIQSNPTTTNFFMVGKSSRKC